MTLEEQDLIVGKAYREYREAKDLLAKLMARDWEIQAAIGRKQACRQNLIDLGQDDPGE